MRRIAVLGSTGSIGTQTLEVVENHPDMEITALAAGSNIRLLEEQIRRFRPKVAAVWSEERAAELKDRVADLDVRVEAGLDGLIAVATEASAQVVVTAVVGMIGIRPTIAAIQAGKDIALANKETLVTAGHLIIPMVRERGVRLLPVDSEHSAIFQCLNGEHGNRIHKILLTASGGPFRGKTREEMKNIQVEDALKHPNWSMGQKITIDSSTLMNKGLEFIEAMWLFSMPPEKIDIVVHPQSIIHSMVEYVDGSVMAQMGAPDMMIPIQYALTWPHRYESPARTLDLLSCGPLTFSQPDTGTFTCLASCIEAAKRGGLYPCVVNGANEEAVSLFLQDKIGYLDLFDAVEAALDHFDLGDYTSVEEVLEADRMARAFVRERYGK